LTTPNLSADAADIESSRVALEKTFDALRSGVDGSVHAFNRIVDQVNDHRWILSPIQLYLIKRSLEEIRGHLKTILDLAEKVLQSGTPVFSLFFTSIDYLKAVEAPLGDVSFHINTPADDNLQYWSGGAASAYRQKQAAQRAAVDKSVDNATAMSKWLFDVGKTNVAYAVELVKIVIDAGMELVNISVDGISVINIQFSLDHVSTLIAKLVKAGLNQLAELANKFVATLGDTRDLLEKRSRHTEFEGGNWPQAVYG
jgi:hypothetical protein